MNRAQAPAHLLLLAACAWLPACGLNQGGVDPRTDTLAYPASAVMDRKGDWLFVTSSNADLRYNDGSLIALSLARAARDRDPNDPRHPKWGECPTVSYANPRVPAELKFCCFDALDPNVLNCDERGYVGAEGDEGDGVGNVRIGSFAAGMVLQTPQCPTIGGQLCSLCDNFSSVEDRLLIGVRGDTSLTYVTVESIDETHPPTMRCVGDAAMPDPQGEFVTCDDNHRVVTAPTGLASASPNEDRQPIPLPDEPYALAIDPGNGLLFIGHLSGNTARAYTGGFSLFDIAPIGGSAGDTSVYANHLGKPRFIAPFSSPFPGNSVGSVGVTALNYAKGTVYASSRYVPEVAGLGTTAHCAESMTSIREIAAFPNGVNYFTPLSAGGETRGIQFVDQPDGSTRAFVLQRSPPALVSFVQGQTPADVLETCGSPTFLDKWDSGVGDRLFVTCFADGEMYVYDPAIPRIVKSFLVGRGPSGLVFDRSQHPDAPPGQVDRNVAYVVGFGDNDISVIDLTPGSLTEYHVIQHIGFPRVTPR